MRWDDHRVTVIVEVELCPRASCHSSNGTNLTCSHYICLKCPILIVSKRPYAPASASEGRLTVIRVRVHRDAVTVRADARRLAISRGAFSMGSGLNQLCAPGTIRVASDRERPRPRCKVGAGGGGSSGPTPAPTDPSSSSRRRRRPGSSQSYPLGRETPRDVHDWHRDRVPAIPGRWRRGSTAR